MIVTATQSDTDCRQREQKEQSHRAWREGDFKRALFLIRSVLVEEMSPPVAAECYSTEAAILADMGDFYGSLESLGNMALVLDAADLRVQGTFYNGRARANKNLGNFQAALIDYGGAVAFWQACGDKDYEGAAYINVAELYLELGDLPRALQNINCALEVLPQDSYYRGDAYDTKAKILLADGQALKALALTEQALERAGEHKEWQAKFSKTQSAIKEHLLDSLIPLVNMPDLDELKVQVIRHALDRAGGSVTIAAKRLRTSHQVVSYTANAHGLERSKRRKSIIKHFN